MFLQRGYHWKPIFIRDTKTFNDMLKTLDKVDVIGADTETTGLEEDSEIVTIQFSDGYNAFVVPSSYLPRLRQFMSNHTFSFHNAMFDIAKLNKKGIFPRKVYDTILMYRWLGRLNTAHNLGAIALLYCGLIKDSYAKVFKEHSFKVNLEKEFQKAFLYAAWDAHVQYHVYIQLYNILKNENMWENFDKNVPNFVDTILDIVNTGLEVDVNKLHKYQKTYDDMLQKMRMEFKHKYPTLNMNSPKQLAEKFFSDKKPIKLTPGGAPSVDVSVLNILARQGDPLATEIVLYRGLEKRADTFLAGIAKHLKGTRIHPKLNIFEAETGRLSSSDPNEQNIPKTSSLTPTEQELGVSLRSLFIPKKGYKLLDLDYSQIEVRVAAVLANDKPLLDAINKGLDLHAAMASNFFKIPYEDIMTAKHAENLTMEQTQLLFKRGMIKTITFGIIYGISAGGMARDITLMGRPMEIQEAREFQRQFLKQHPGLSSFFKQQYKNIQEKGYVETILGRRRYIQYGNSYNIRLKASAERKAVNTPVQGSAFDVIMLAMNSIHKDPVLNNMGVKTILQVHDELMFEVPEDHLDEAEKLIREHMLKPTETLHLPIRLDVDGSIGDNWEQIH